MIFLICVLALIKGNGACIKTVPGDVPHIDDPVCNKCAAATDVKCPEEHMCDFSYLKRAKNGAKCSTYSCSKGQMIAYVSQFSSAVDSAVCDKNGQLVWKTETGEVYGKSLQATCAFPCATCSEITTVTSPCPVNYDCTAKTDALTYSADFHGCISAKCAKGQMFSKGHPVTQATCIDGTYRISGKAASQVACGTPCDACTALLNDGLTCPDGHTCTKVSQRKGRCSEAYCDHGIMAADGVTVKSLTCNGRSQWVDSAGTTYTAAQCELTTESCVLCTTLTNTGMACPEGLLCAPPSEREGGCKETYCPTGTMTAGSERTSVTSLTCNGLREWVNDEKVVFTSAQCETPCNQCTALTNTEMTCPTGFVCTAAASQSGQCPVMTCTVGEMKANPGNVAVTSLSCDGTAQWIDSQSAVYTAAQCESSCTQCTALTNTGMPCPEGLLCVPAQEREGQCSEIYCASGTLTGNADRTSPTLLTCNAAGAWVDTQAATYSTAQCETPCNQCTALTNTEMTCPTGFVCTAAVSHSGQCPVMTCTVGDMKANPGNVAVTSLSCDGAAQWVDSQSAVYTAAQCESSCTQCTALTNTDMPCPEGLLCVPAQEREGQCSEIYCASGTLTGNADRTSPTLLTCNAAGAWVDTQAATYSTAQCETPCNQCTALTNTEMTCPTGFVCTAAVSQSGQCPVITCTVGEMKANPGNVAVTSLSCNGAAQWIDSQSAVYTAAQCESSCTQCTALTNTDMPCPEGLLCVPAQEREGQCSEIFCASGTLTGNAGRTSLTLLTCNTAGAWVDTQAATYTTAQCETPCDQCIALTNTEMTCPAGFVCTAAGSQSGQCPVMTCTVGEMKANPGNVAVTSLSCDGAAQWIDSQSAVYTAAQCELSCDQCTALTNTGMSCPTGFVCTPAVSQSGQCPVMACTAGDMKANPGNVAVTSLSCDGAAQWIDSQSAIYTAAQCESPCTQCAALTNTGMPCPEGLLCAPAQEREGQCSEIFCASGTLTGNAGRTPLTLLTCNAAGAWVDTQAATYTTAQCETPCNQCTALTNTGMTCPTGFVCTAAASQSGQCPVMTCTVGEMKVNPGNVAVTSLSCDGTAQWIDSQSAVYTAAQCESSCTQCVALTNAGMPCPEGLLCAPAQEREGQCSEIYCASGTLTGNAGRTSLTLLTCNTAGAWTDTQAATYTTAQCETPCDQCTALTNTGMTCPTGFVCTAAVSQSGQCPVITCTVGEMKANPGNVAVTSLSCDGAAQWIDSQSAVYTAAQCEASCTQCAALTNTGMPCPKGLLCVPAQEREGQCSEIYCARGTLTGNAGRTSLTLLTCNTAGAWVDAQSVTYTTAQCETPCNQCTSLLNTGMACPSGFRCKAVLTRSTGQCPEVYCDTGLMTAGTGRTTVTQLSCNGLSQWVDPAGAIYSVAQCESACTQCAALTNTGMLCPKGLLCVPPQEREGQCSEIYCARGTLTGNAGRTSLTLLTCNTAGAWVDAQSVTYTTAQCETPCDQCTSLLNTGMACPSGFRCKAVLTRSTGQCPEVYCDTGLMTAGTGRTTVTQLSCNGLSQWVDPAGAIYSVAQCETGCTCPALPVTASPNPPPTTRGRNVGTGDGGCSTLSPGCTANDRYRLVTSNGVVTLEPPAAQTTQMTCVSGQWMTTINGAQTVVQQQACYLFSCTLCPAVIGGAGVTVTIGYNPTTWCKLYTLSGCANGYRVMAAVGPLTITGPLTCDALMRWGSGSFNGNAGQAVTVDCG